MDIETEVRDIKQHVIEIAHKIDGLVQEKELFSLMKLTEKSLSEFFKDEPDIYTIDDLKARYIGKSGAPI